MKRYWKLISLFLFTIVVWAGFFIQSTFAVSNYPEFVINSKDDQDELESRMVISGDYRDSKDRMEHLTIRSEEHTSELQSRFDLVCRLLLEKKKNRKVRKNVLY